VAIVYQNITGFGNGGGKMREGGMELGASPLEVM